MRIKALLLITALGAIALPASAQGNYQSCVDQKNNNRVGGAIVGGILGGVLGSNTAARGHRGDGTAVGAVLGGIIGSGVGGSVNCTRDQRGYAPPPPPGSTYYPNPNYGGPNYDGYGSGGQGYGYSPANDYPYDPGYSSDYGYADRDGKPQRNRGDGLYARDSRSYKNDGYAGRDCSEATQITRLPDGTTIRRPVEACRDAYYGDWQVRD